MNGEKTTKRVFRMMMAWNDQKEERWLSDQAKSGWHMTSVNAFGYTFERGAPADVAYRFDWGPGCRRDQSEYLGIFRDSGWEYMGRRGRWNIFRKPVVGGVVPEIYTDPQSRIRMYQRVIGFLCAFFAIMVGQMVPQISREASPANLGRFPWVMTIYCVLTAFFLYGIVRMVFVIRRLRRSAPTPS
jgi:hypothetical protein